MEETNESRNHHAGNKNMVIKIGSGGGGGIGAVVLLGGALATAAFASAFVLGKKRRSSDKDGSRNSSPEIDEKREKEEAKKEQELISNGEKEEEKDSTIMNDSAHTLKMVEDDPVSDDGFVIVKEEIPIPSLAENIKQETVSDDHSKESTNLEQVNIERERESGGDGDGEIDAKEEENSGQEDINGVQIDVNMEEKKEIYGNGETNEEKRLEPEATEIGMVDLSGNDEIVFSQSHEEDSVQMVEATVKSEEDEGEEKSVINGCTLLTVVEEVRENEAVNEEENTSMQVEEELISPEEAVEVVKYVANEEVPQNPKNEAGSQPEDVETETEKEVEQELIVDEKEVSRKDGDEESNEAVEKKSLKMMDFDEKGEENSKWEAQWQGEWLKVSSKELKQRKLTSYEVGGKIQEDYPANDEVMEEDNHPSISTRWRMMIWTLSVLLSLSGSWLFDLSPTKLCLVVFLTVFLLEIYGYPLLNRKQARSLHAAKGERVYEQRSLKK